MSADRSRDRLGRGLSALLGEHLDGPEVQEGETRTVPVRAVVPNPFQPRREFSPEELDDLQASIKENGLLQPIVVRPAPGAGGKFELVAGERRFRSVKGLGWDEIPAVVRDVEDRTLLVLALVENIQRSQLNPLEEAEGYQALKTEFGLSQEGIAQAVGKSRAAVANLLRLLKLPPSVRRLVADGTLSAGHARALLAVDDDLRAGELARQAVKDGWSVREMERRVAREIEGGGGRSRRKKSSPPVDPGVRALQEALQEALGTRVTLKQSGGTTGRIEIPFSSSEDFERLFELLTGSSTGEVLD
jgi:ParB family chromosome partitioning protein